MRCGKRVIRVTEIYGGIAKGGMKALAGNWVQRLEYGVNFYVSIRRLAMGEIEEKEVLLDIPKLN